MGCRFVRDWRKAESAIPGLTRQLEDGTFVTVSLSWPCRYTRILLRAVASAPTIKQPTWPGSQSYSNTADTADLYPSRHGSAGWFPRHDPVVAPDALRGFVSGPLSTVQLERLEREGFLVLPQFFTDRELSLLVDAAGDSQQFGTGESQVTDESKVVSEKGTSTLRTAFELHKLPSDNPLRQVTHEQRIVQMMEQVRPGTPGSGSARIRLFPSGFSQPIWRTRPHALIGTASAAAPAATTTAAAKATTTAATTATTTAAAPAPAEAATTAPAATKAPTEATTVAPADTATSAATASTAAPTKATAAAGAASTTAGRSTFTRRAPALPFALFRLPFSTYLLTPGGSYIIQ